MSKLDLLNKEAKTKLEQYLEPDMSALLSEEMDDDEEMLTRFQKLNHALATLVGALSQLVCHIYVAWKSQRCSRGIK